MGNIRRFSVTAACLFSFVGSQVSADHHAAMKPSVPPLDLRLVTNPRHSHMRVPFSLVTKTKGNGMISIDVAWAIFIAAMSGCNDGDTCKVLFLQFAALCGGPEFAL